MSTNGLESKAKTRGTIIGEYLKELVKAYCSSDMPSIQFNDPRDNELLIPLKEAQKREEQLKTEFYRQVRTAELLEAKIAEANKILEEYTPKMIGWNLAKKVRCALCSIEDCSTKGSLEPEECLLQREK